MADWQSEDWDPAKEKALVHKRIRDMGMEPLGFYGLLRHELLLFEARLDAWCRCRYQDTGVAVPDWRRQKHRSMFNKILDRKYVTHDMDPEFESKLKPTQDSDLAAMRERAEVEMTMRLAPLGAPTPEAQDALRELGLLT